MKLRRLIVPIALVALVAAACGDDGGSSTPSTPSASESPTGGDSGDDTPPPAGNDTPAPSATGGTLSFGDETIALDSARCFLEDQEAFGGGTIHAVAQGFGTNAAGQEILLDFTRWGEDTDFTGDDIIVSVGDFTSEDYAEYSVVLDVGAVSIDGRNVSADGFTLTSFDMDPPGELEASFALSC